MKSLSIIILLSLVSSCSLFEKRKIDYSESYVTGEALGIKTSDQIKENLRRNLSMGGGNYQISAFPMTKAYIEAYSREQIELKGLSTRSAKNLRTELEKKYVSDKVCIESTMLVKEFEKVNSLNEWKLVLVDSNNIAYQLDWLKDPPSNIEVPKPIVSTKPSYHGKEKTWTLIGQACSVARVDMKKGFKVIFTPSFVQWPFPDETSEEWTFDYTEVVDGKKVLKKKKERRKQGYRGW